MVTQLLQQCKMLLRKRVFLSSVRLILVFAAQGSQDLTEETESMMESSAPRLRRCGYCLLQVTMGIGRETLFTVNINDISVNGCNHF